MGILTKRPNSKNILRKHITKSLGINYKCYTRIWWINSWKNYEHMNMNRGKSMNPWIWIWPKTMNPWISIPTNLWTHEFHLLKIHKPVNMNTDIAINSWIWILFFSWTREYEYGHVAPWTFKSSYSSRKSMNHSMNPMNCNAC